MTWRPLTLPPSARATTRGSSIIALPHRARFHVRSIVGLYRECGKAVGPPLQIGSRNERFLADLADWNFATGNQLIEFRFPDRCQPAALGNRVQELIHMTLAICSRGGPGDLARALVGYGEMSRGKDRGNARRDNGNKRSAVVALSAGPAALRIVSSDTSGGLDALSFAPTRQHKAVFAAHWPSQARAASTAGRIGWREAGRMRW